MVTSPYFFYFDVLSSIKEICIAINSIKEFNKPFLIGAHISEGTSLPSGEKISDIIKNIDSQNLLGLILACVSPENFQRNIVYTYIFKYSNKIHHLRDANRWGNKENGYLFSIINENNKKGKEILFQGDSWIESISEIKQSEKIIKNFAINNNFSVYNGGITSFAPSLMHKQYEILKQEFNIMPDIIIIYIDQTDIGDEYCRYKNKKIYSKNGKLKRISREKFTRATYDYSKLYLYSDLSFQSTFNKIIYFPAK